ncbi:hypothetical protein [Natranaerofaba carboxydovora]|uniref:hypothetical protein n=1 Tax=Natranaerofaba carboxydovora TaxID=2742683 RepID=UPI001F146D94|nr:hypothetical protein [Natranaerofaba carboxydovora]UMZ73983.1 hypothetical protein ACONDI_01553 [Natranaerofaba carboxydovora]
MKKILPNRGSILIYVLFVMSVVFIISIHSLNISLNDRVVAGTVEDDKKGYYIAKAGNEFAIYMFVNGEMDLNDEITKELNGGYFEASILELEIINKVSDPESDSNSTNEYEKKDDEEAEEELDDEIEGEIEEEDDLGLSVRVFINSTGYYYRARYNMEKEYEVKMPTSFFEADKK